MAYTPLSALLVGNAARTVCLRVPRLWHQRGGLEVGPVKYIHMVLVDGQGYAMYARVDASIVGRFLRVLTLGALYEIAGFLVFPRNFRMKAVPTPFTMKLTADTTMVNLSQLFELDIPRWVFNLTALLDLATPTGTMPHLIDVIGVITHVSNLAVLNYNKRSTPIKRRDIFIADPRTGCKVKIALIGQAAERFLQASVWADGAQGPAVAIFTGLMVKRHRGVLDLYGSIAADWYINQDIEQINALRSSLGNQPSPILKAPAPEFYTLTKQLDGWIPPRNIDGLINFDLFLREDAIYECEVTLFALSSGTSWWFSACTVCQQPPIPDGPSYAETQTYTCTDDTFQGTSAELRYRFYIKAFYDTDLAEFVLLDDATEKMIGAPLMQVLQRIDLEKSTVSNLDYCADHHQFIPKEIIALTGRKCKLAVSVTETSFAEHRFSFQVIGVTAA